MWYKLNWIYVWNQKVRPSGWKPWANTIAYYPLTSETTVNDMSGNNHNLTNSWASFWTYWNVSCVSLNWSSNYLLGNIWDISLYSHTINIWVYVKWEWMINMYGQWDPNHKWWAEVIQYHQSKFRYSYWYDDLDSTNTYSINGWHNVCAQWDRTSNKQIIYVDWVAQWDRTPTYTHTIWNTQNFTLWKNSVYSEAYFNWYISEYIIENKIWTAQEIVNYYNNTKANYWL
jgi:hypothetical protein